MITVKVKLMFSEVQSKNDKLNHLLSSAHNGTAWEWIPTEVTYICISI